MKREPVPCDDHCTKVIAFDCCGKSYWSCETIRTRITGFGESDTVIVCAEGKGCNTLTGGN